MIVVPDKVDSYLHAKGIAPRMSDAEWTATIGVLAQFLKEGRGFRVKLLHQKEDALRRFSSDFPESVPQPYRFIDYIQFSASGLAFEAEVIAELKKWAIPFHIEHHRNGPEDDDIIPLINVGPKARDENGG